MSAGTSGLVAVTIALLVAVLTLPLSAGGAGAGSPSSAELAALARPLPRSALSAQHIYFVLTDRFANGDTKNDRGGRTGPAGVTGFAPADTGFFHGGDLSGLTAGLDYVKRLGMTAIWVTPPVVQRTVQGVTAGYHGYWGTDFTNVDPHLGSNEDFRRFVSRAHALGLKVVLDVVANHTGDVVAYRGAGAAGAPYVEQTAKPYRDTEGRPFDPAAAAQANAFPELYPDARSFPYQPVVAPADTDVKKPSWLNDLRNYHNRGDSTFAGESVTFGDFFGLDDLFTERPEVVQGQIELWSDWIRDYQLDGFRLDTVRHVDPPFWRTFLPAIGRAARAAGRPDFSVFGEVFDPASTAATIRRVGMLSVLDFSFPAAVVPFAAGIGDASDLAALFDQDDLYTTASSSAYDLTTFLGNHDVGRVGFTLIGAAGGDKRRALSHDLLAHDLLFLLRGAPVLYYGDEAGMTGSGDGKDRSARQDMFPTAVAAWRTEPRIGARAVGRRSSFDLTHPVARRIQALTTLVDRNPALRNGAQITRFTGRGGAKSVYAVSRIERTTRTEYLVAFNNGSAGKTVRVPTSSPRTRFDVIWPLQRRGDVSDRAGLVTVTVPAGGSTVLRATRRLPAAPGRAVTLAQPVLDETAGLFRLGAEVPGVDAGSVTFAARSEGTKGWVRLGTDDARPFRLVLQPGRFVRGRSISIVAIARSSSGRTTVSSTRSLVRR